MRIRPLPLAETLALALALALAFVLVPRAGFRVVPGLARAAALGKARSDSDASKSPSQKEASRAASILFELGDISWHRAIFPSRSPVDASAVPRTWEALVSRARDGPAVLEGGNSGSTGQPFFHDIHARAFHMAKRVGKSAWTVVKRAHSSVLSNLKLYVDTDEKESSGSQESKPSSPPLSFDRAYALRSALSLFAASTRAGPGPGAGAALFALGEINAHAACGAGSTYCA